MVPWKFLAGVAACVAFPQQKGIILVVGGVTSLLLTNGKGKRVELEETDVSGKIKRVTLEWKDIDCSYFNKKEKKVIKCFIVVTVHF